MCGIVGAISERNVANILIEGLKRLEYRGYDSAGLALLNQGAIVRERQAGKVALLADAVAHSGIKGTVGIAHTRWATHGAPTVDNAHPHQSGHIVVVHNGIIENHAELKAQLLADGYVFSSQTDTEVIAHLVLQAYKQDPNLLNAVNAVIPQLHGAYALGIISSEHPDELIAVRAGSPLVVGLGIDENFIGSDQLALLPVTHKFIYLEEGDVVRLCRDSVSIFAHGTTPITRNSHELDAQEASSDKGTYKHYMLKEIHEQPDAVNRTLNAYLEPSGLKSDFLSTATLALQGIERIQILACGTSFHAGMVAKYWLERIARIPCSIEIASEFRYRSPVVSPRTLVVSISQSGETADTLAAIRDIKANMQATDGIVFLSICNVATSTMVRESTFALLTHAGPEIGVASTKAFTTQLVALFLLVLKVGQVRNQLSADAISQWVHKLWHLPAQINQALGNDGKLLALSKLFVEKNHALFLGRGVQFAIALEGALKLKEISYIHAEGYAAGELKHGPLALVDNDMPIVVIAPADDMLDKLKSNMQEVQARGGELFVMADENSGITADARTHVVYIPAVDAELAPIVYSIPVQQLSYHVAVLRGTDVDQPRNLAKSVTVE